MLLCPNISCTVKTSPVCSYKRWANDFRKECVARCPLSPAASKASFSTLCAALRVMRCFPFPFREGNRGRLAFTVRYCSRCQRTKSSMARMPSVFTGTALDTSPPLTIDRSKSKSVTADRFCHTSPIVRLSSSLMRPPVLTPSMKSPRLRTSYGFPVKHAETSRISSLSNGLVPFMAIFLFRRCHPVGYVVTKQTFLLSVF